MTTSSLRRPVTLGAISGVVFAGFIVVSSLFQFDLGIWETANSSLFLGTLVIAGYLGLSTGGALTCVRSIAVYYAIITGFFLAGYLLATTLLVERMAWVPFWYRDYTYHGFRSVSDYMAHHNNFRELLILQIISCFICSVLYLITGFAGFAIGRLSPKWRNGLDSPVDARVS